MKYFFVLTKEIATFQIGLAFKLSWIVLQDPKADPIKK